MLPLSQLVKRLYSNSKWAYVHKLLIESSLIGYLVCFIWTCWHSVHMKSCIVVSPTVCVCPSVITWEGEVCQSTSSCILSRNHPCQVWTTVQSVMSPDCSCLHLITRFLRFSIQLCFHLLLIQLWNIFPQASLIPMLDWPGSDAKSYITKGFENEFEFWPLCCHFVWIHIWVPPLRCNSTLSFCSLTKSI